MVTSTETPIARRAITNEDELLRFLSGREAATVHAVGAAGSKSPCYQTSGTALHLHGFNNVIAVDGNRVTVQAGATVGRLNAELARRGLALPTHGEWAGATVAGSMTSGTHGGSAHHGILATSAVALRLVTAEGVAHDLRRGDPLFDHAAVSLGLLGVITHITFECVEHFHLAMTMQVRRFPTFVATLADEQATHEFHAAIWIPTAERVVSFAADRVHSPRRTQRRRERFSPATFVLSKLSRDVGLHLIPCALFSGTVVDAADRILTPIRDGSKLVGAFRAISNGWHAAEMAVPLERAGEALERLHHFLSVRPRALVNPVGLRATAADTFTLSPCVERATFWFDLFYRDDPQFETDLSALFEDLDGRAHWGKHVALSPAHLQRQYPGWEAFRAARRRLDPADRFGNQFSRRYGL